MGRRHNESREELAPPTVSFIITTSRGKRTYQYTVARSVLHAALIALGALVLLCIVGAVRLVVVSGVANQTTRLRAENDSLSNQFSRLQLLENELDRLSADNRRIRELAGIPTTPEDSENGSVANTTSKGAASDVTRPWEPTAPTLAPRKGPISRGFQMDSTGVKRHGGVDIPGPVGAPVLAAGGGIVLRASFDEALGEVVVIDHGNGLESYYGHNQELMVSEGDSVAQGEQIAKLGNTGRSSAPHLHFEVRKDGVSIDPSEFVRDYQESP